MVFTGSDKNPQSQVYHSHSIATTNIPSWHPIHIAQLMSSPSHWSSCSLLPLQQWRWVAGCSGRAKQGVSHGGRMGTGARWRRLFFGQILLRCWSHLGGDSCHNMGEQHTKWKGTVKNIPSAIDLQKLVTSGYIWLILYIYIYVCVYAYIYTSTFQLGPAKPHGCWLRPQRWTNWALLSPEALPLVQKALQPRLADLEHLDVYWYCKDLAALALVCLNPKLRVTINITNVTKNITNNFQSNTIIKTLFFGHGWVRVAQSTGTL